MVAAAAAGASSVTVELVANPDISGQYWRDITGADYSPSFRNTYTYDDATVSLTYGISEDRRFRGSLTGTGLKPNFCYQTKLSGKPEAEWGADGDDWSNEALGYEGRWWRSQPEPPGNSNDAEYEANKDDPDYLFSGYLVYGFFVTDDNGDIDIPSFESGNSFHVIWKESQRPPEANDGPISYYTVDSTTVGLYGEWEPTRDLPGDMYLPLGSYNVSFHLTEESFHDYPASWALAMTRDDIGFTITPEPTAVCIAALGGLLAWARRRRGAAAGR
jgi:hypothetical protein